MEIGLSGNVASILFVSLNPSEGGHYGMSIKFQLPTEKKWGEIWSRLIEEGTLED